MANIVDPRAISFTGEKARVAADKIAQAYYFAKIVVDEWFAEGLSSVITNSSDDIIEDAAYFGDGRKVVTGAEVTNIMTRCIDLVNDMEANSNAKLNTVLNVAVNPER